MFNHKSASNKWQMTTVLTGKFLILCLFPYITQTSQEKMLSEDIENKAVSVSWTYIHAPDGLLLLLQKKNNKQAWHHSEG